MTLQIKRQLLFGFAGPALVAGLALVGPDRVEAAELFPGALVDPFGRQANMVIEYNPFRDNYLLGYSNGRAVIGHMSTDGVFSNQILISANTGVASMALAYNSERNEFLYVWRNGSPNTIRARYLDTDGNPLGSELALGNGKEPHLAYSPDSDRYVVTWAEPGGNIRYRVIGGDSTDPTPLIASGYVATANALSDALVYGSVAGKFLVAYVRDFSGKADLFGRFISADGTSLGAQFAIDAGDKNQQGPRVGYTPKANRFIVGYQSWTRNPPDLNVALVAPSGAVTKRFLAAKKSPWEVPGTITYNDATQTVVFAWREAGNSLIQALAQEWDVGEADAHAVGPLVLLSSLDADVQSAAARPDSSDPQVAVLWRVGLGLDGLHAGIVEVSPPPPDLTAPDAVSDLSGTPGAPPERIVGLTAIDSSSESGSNVMQNTTDENASTFWSTVTSSTLHDEFITWDLGAVTDVSKVRLQARASGNLFPLDYQIQLSSDGVNFSSPVASITGAVVPPGAWADHTFTPAPARYVRLLVTRPRQTGGGSYRVHLAEVEIFESPGAIGTVTLNWTAPGDDFDEGTAAEYEMRWSLNPITTGNFGSANLASISPPQPAGATETAQISGLPDETAVYVALKTKDEANNVSGLSNVAMVPTPGIAPAPVDDLTVTSVGSTSVSLEWHATGDDGYTGTASLFDLRWALAPITDANFDLANLVSGEPTPGPPGTLQSVTVMGLPAETKVYFGIKVLDEVGNASLADTGSEPSATTTDTVSPAPVTDLMEAPGGGALVKLAAPAIAASAQVSSAKGRAKATDGDVATYWQTPGASTMGGQWITLDTGATHNLAEIRLRSRDAGSLFPEDLQIQVSGDNVHFTPVKTVTGLPATPGIWTHIGFGPVAARYVRVDVTRARSTPTGVFIVQIAEIELYESPVVNGSVALTWTAPGDNGNSGTATEYDLRWSLNPINAGNFGSATPFVIPAPKPPGSQETAIVTGLPDERMVYFALRTRDEVPNWSLISNVATAETPGVAPAAVNDLAVVGANGTEIDLQWTATGDDVTTGTAAAYDIRRSSAPITEGNFDAATPLPGPPSPAPPGSTENYTATGLTGETTYYFAIRVRDELNNWSAINSNGPVSGATTDVVGPGAITDLLASSSAGMTTLLSAPAIASSGQLSGTKGPDQATDGNPTSYWSTPARATMQDEFLTLDAGTTQSIGRVRLRSRDSGSLFPEDLEIQVSNDNLSFSPVHTAAGLPGTPGMWHTFDFTPAPARYVRVLVTKSRASAGGTFYVQIAEAEVYETAPGTQVTLTWTSPGDNPGFGTPTLYDVRYATSPILTNGAFNSATTVAGAPTPHAFGQQESMTIDSPEEGTTIHFAVKAKDEVNNTGPLSNSAPYTSMIVAPSPVSDLTVSTVESTSVELVWTATGDDGANGQASDYDLRYSQTPLNAGNFGSGIPVPGVVTPSLPGTTETALVSGLSPSTQYYFALKVIDDTMTASPISNVPTATTDVPDTTAPAAVSDLRGGPPFNLVAVAAPAIDASSEVKPKEFATDADPNSYWGTSGSASLPAEYITLDTGAIRFIGQVRLLSRSAGAVFPEDLEIQVSDDNLTFTPVAEFTGLSDAQGLWHDLEILPAASGRYVRVEVTKPRKTAGGDYMVQIAEIQVKEAQFIAGPIAVAWTAPGDDGAAGTVEEYDLRWSLNPINSGNFDFANPLATPSPSPAGATESVNINGLPGSSTIYFAIKSRDEVPNVSAISNVIMVMTP